MSPFATMPAAAQLSVAGSVSLATPYIWRGVTRANGWNVQPEGFLAGGLAGGYLTSGVWANLEAGRSSPGNLSNLGGARPGFSEVNIWLQFSRLIGELETTVGAVRYLYPGDPPDASRTSGDNTTELYGGVQLRSTYLVPRLMAHWDVDRVQGFYLEGSFTIPLLAYPFGNPIVFYASGLGGFNLGQDQNPDRPNQNANFRGDGFTHFDFSLRATIHLGGWLPLSMNLEPHWQFKVDDFTKRTSPEAGDSERHTQFWLGLSLSSGFTLLGGTP
jgi:hypothetical protein